MKAVTFPRTFESAVRSFTKKVRDDEGHKPILALSEDKQSYWGSAYSFTMKCECGKEWMDYTDKNAQKHYTGSNGDILTSELRAFNQHIALLNDELRVTDTPILVAKIHKVRVTNEVWLFHKDHEQPTTAPIYYDWTVWMKQSNGWKARGGARSLEGAQLQAASYVETHENVHRVEWMDSDSVGVQAPVATIISAATKLVLDAKELKDTPTAIRDHLELVNDGITQLNILKQLKVELEERLYDHMDLGL